MSKFNDNNLKDYTIIKGESEAPCEICKENTRYIDYCCEVHVCSEECYKELAKIISELRKNIYKEEK